MGTLLLSCLLLLSYLLLFSSVSGLVPFTGATLLRQLLLLCPFLSPSYRKDYPVLSRFCKDRCPSYFEQLFIVGFFFVRLSIAAKRMAAQNVLVKDLQGVETLGALYVKSIICLFFAFFCFISIRVIFSTLLATDKTGTLTRNQMTVTNLWNGNQMSSAFQVCLTAAISRPQIFLSHDSLFFPPSPTMMRRTQFRFHFQLLECLR